MNPLVIVGAVALIGFLATMKGKKVVAAPPTLPPLAPPVVPPLEPPIVQPPVVPPTIPPAVPPVLPDLKAVLNAGQIAITVQ